jgi:hypothetical protein
LKIFLNSTFISQSDNCADSDTGVESMQSIESRECNGQAGKQQSNQQAPKSNPQQLQKQNSKSECKSCSMCMQENQQSQGNNNNNYISEHADKMTGYVKEISGLKYEVTRLKCDKLDLLRQNVVSFSTHVKIVLI